VIKPKKNEKKSNIDIMLLVYFMPILYLWWYIFLLNNTMP
jgi:hypothetical protein